MAARKKRYSLVLEGPQGKTEFPPPDSVTEIIKAVFSESFGPASWWGYKVGGAAMLGIDNLKDPQVLELYDKLKATGIHPNSIKDDAAERGKSAHKVAEDIGNGELTYDDVAKIYSGADDISGYHRAAGLWARDHADDGFVNIGSEVQVFNPILYYVGTFDRLRRNSLGVEEVVDWKTAKPPVRFEQHLQLAFYDLALGGPPREQRVVLFKPDGTYEESSSIETPKVFVDPAVVPGVVEVFKTIQRWKEEAKS